MTAAPTRPACRRGSAQDLLIHRLVQAFVIALGLALVVLATPALAGSPFATGATALSTNAITILTPIAVIAVIALGVMAWFNKLSWGWLVAIILGIVLVFGAQQFVTWIRGLFGV